MARYTYDLVLNKPEDFVQFVMNDFLQKNRFEPADYNGEAVYRAGDRMVEGHKYLKWSYTGGVFQVEAWLKAVSGEMGLDGFSFMRFSSSRSRRAPDRAPRQDRVCSRAHRQVRDHSRCRSTRWIIPSPQPWQWCLES